MVEDDDRSDFCVVFEQICREEGLVSWLKGSGKLLPFL